MEIDFRELTETRIYEHKLSIKKNDDRNNLRAQTQIQFLRAKLMKAIHRKHSLKLQESAVISKTNHTKQRPSFTKSHHTWRTLY